MSYCTDKYVIQEVATNRDWLYLTGQLAHIPLSKDEKTRMKLSSHNITPIKEKQLLLIDVYTKWTGPCVAAESYLRRIRHAFVEAPDSLVLGRACCDNIEELEAFRHDIRPTFLFWARGRPVALLRGANRPLLTKLIHQEVDIEIRQDVRSLNVEVDFHSDKVIQCGGDLANLDDDAIVRSIGLGNTEKLSSLNGLRQIPINKEEDTATNATVLKPIKKKKSKNGKKGSLKNKLMKNSLDDGFYDDCNLKNALNEEDISETKEINSELQDPNQDDYDSTQKSTADDEEYDENDEEQYSIGYQETDTDEEDENENLSQENSYSLENNDSLSDNLVTSCINGASSIEDGNIQTKASNQKEEPGIGSTSSDVDHDSKYKINKDPQEYGETGEAENGENDILDTLREEDEEDQQEISDDENNVNSVLVRSLLGAVISKAEDANKAKTNPFGRKKMKKKKKMETGLLKEILDFRPMGARRHFSYH